jgi:hypothetical protein
VLPQAMHASNVSSKCRRGAVMPARARGHGFWRLHNKNSCIMKNRNEGKRKQRVLGACRLGQEL